jgi:hypothetical protein
VKQYLQGQLKEETKGCTHAAPPPPPTAASILGRIEEVKKLIKVLGNSWRGVRGAALG